MIYEFTVRINMAVVYYWESGWHKLATYPTETAVKVVNDPLIYHLLGVYEMCATDTETDEVIASNTIDKV